MTLTSHTEASIRHMIGDLPIRARAGAESLLANPWNGNYHQALEQIAKQVLEMDRFEDLLQAGNPYVPCRLCGSMGHAIEPRGYRYPEGVRRHLAGTHKARMCEVTKAIIEYARARDRADSGR